MDVKTIMTSDETGSGMVEYAHNLASKLVNEKLGRSQIRNIFSEVRQIELMWNSENQTDAVRRLTMLKPKLAYQTGRHKSVKGLKNVLEPAIDIVINTPEGEDRDKVFQRFVDFFEAILAYHRLEGGRD